MRFIKLFLISAVVLFLVMMAFSFLFPSHLRVSRAINIAASGERVRDTLSNLRSWDHWNQFISLTPLTGKSFSEPSSGAGAFLRSDQLSILILQAARDSIRVGWVQKNGRSFTGGFNLMQLSRDSLTVQWYFDFRFRWYPWEKFGSMVYDQHLGPLMEGSLAGLKQLMENAP